MTNNIVVMDNVSKYYGNFCALNKMSFSIKEGEIVGLLGPNGAGKSTAMRIMTCFMPATSGKVTVAGFDTFENPDEVKRNIGYLPETPPLYENMTVLSYLKFAAAIHEIPQKEIASRVGYVIERLGLNEVKRKIIANLSKGYKQRVGLAQAIIHKPKLLILDEPTVGLDPKQIIEIRTLIKSLAGEHTVILSSHILSEVSMTCGRVIIIKEGMKIAEDTVLHLEQTAQSEHRYNIKLILPKDFDFQAETASLASFSLENAVQEDRLLFLKANFENEGDYDIFFNKLTSKGVVFREVTPYKPTLEEVFISLTSSDGKEND
ncbi:MAG: ABC transporter ATP-binding protein [Candidatus Riflebacteria bacterium]|nr:ABC transporter ATP-binding protein [Candidatus Riflebacteria bacterium]